MQLTIKKETEETIEVSFVKPVYLTIQDAIFYRFAENEKGEVIVTYLYIDLPTRFELRSGKGMEHDFKALVAPNWKPSDKATFDAKLSEVLARINYTSL